jgi:hypothetical protein
VPVAMTEQQQSRRLAHSRKVWNSNRDALAPFQKADLTAQEKADLDRAWRASTLRHSSTSYRPKFINLTTRFVSFSGVLLSLLALPLFAYCAHFHKLLAPADVVASLAGWSFSAALLAEMQRSTGWTLINPYMILPAGFLLVTLLVNTHGRTTSGSSVHVVPMRYVTLSVTIGMAGLPLILQLLRILDWIDNRIGMALSRRLRASDVLFVQLARCAAWAWSAYSTGSRAQWNDPDFARRFISRLHAGAKRVDQATILSRRTRWSQLRLRSREGAPYFAVASVLRDHAQSVATAKNSDDWLRICQSLTAGAVAAARDDWDALLAHAPAGAPGRRAVALQVLRRMTAPAVLALSGILLPIWISLGEYGGSVRTSLLVAAVVSLLPGSDTINSVLARALPSRSES